jgi:outer membrane lipoprotein SlyB
MKSVVGIFTSREAAVRAAEALREGGIKPDAINLISPDAARSDLEAVPVDTGERPGIGAALGGVVGAVSGAQLGMVAATFFLPGVGPVIATGLAAAALFGIGGAAAGDALETTLTDGLPKDELFVYEDALRRGRTVLVVLVDDDAEAKTAREALADAGAESVDAARERWWIAVREHEAAEYAATGRDFSSDERIYRRGFEMALDPAARGKSYEEAVDYLRRCYPDVYGDEVFRHGYERGCRYAEREGDRKAA